ncbi:unnamed protein product [Rhizoctonia solani]|nr:unnamed protein product [Rhizoctonia solani]
MGRRTSTSAAGSKQTNSGPAWRLTPFISSIFYILLSIFHKINFSPLKLALVTFIRHRLYNAPAPSTDSTPTANLPHRHSVVQGSNIPPAVQAEVQNDNQAAPLLPFPPPIVPRRNAHLGLMGSLTGFLVE